MTKRVTIKAEGMAASDYYAAKLARFRAAQAHHKERKQAQRYAKQLAYNRTWLRRYLRRLKQEQKEQLKRLLQDARRIVDEAMVKNGATKLKMKADKLAAAKAKADVKTELTRLKALERRKIWEETNPITEHLRRGAVRTERLKHEEVTHV
jgi:hypothetical protein